MLIRTGGLKLILDKRMPKWEACKHRWGSNSIQNRRWSSFYRSALGWKHVQLIQWMRSNVSAVINQTHPFSETRRMCACVRVGEWTCLLASRAPARHNSVAGGWRLAGVELCRSCWSLRWSLSVSVARAVINHERVGERTRPAPPLSPPPQLPTALTPHRSANPDLNGRITVCMMSGLKNHRSETMPHNSSGSPRAVSVDMGELIVWRGTVPCFCV